MHSLFKNDDVLYEIFVQLAGDVRSPEFTSTAQAQRSILHLGLTNKRLLDAALDRLWYSIGSLAHLALVLPKVAKDGSGNTTVAGILRDKHLQRFKYYAQRVRFFTNTGKSLSPVLYLLLSSIHTEALLPNLRGFHCILHSHATISEIACIIRSPQLKTFIVTSDETLSTSSYASLGAEAIILLASLQGASLTSLNIEARIPYVRYLTEFKLLAAFSAPNPLAPLELCSLTKLSNLQRVNVVLPGSSNDLSELTLKLPRDIFPNLRGLIIKGSIGGIHVFMQRICASSLSHLQIEVSDQDSSGVWDSVFYLVKRRWSSTLKRLHLKASGQNKIPSAVLSPTGNFELEYLRLDGWGGIGIDVLRQLCAPFSSLKGLHIHCTYDGEFGWDALPVIHECLPALEDLHIWLNWSLVIALPLRPYSPFPSRHPLKRLSVGFHQGTSNFVTIDQIKIARGLDILFPFVEVSSVPERMVFVEGIQFLLSAFREIRCEARKRWEREERASEPVLALPTTKEMVDA